MTPAGTGFRSQPWRWRWELRWDGPRYRGRYREVTWRDVWWVPLLVLSPAAPAYAALVIWYLWHWLAH